MPYGYGGGSGSLLSQPVTDYNAEQEDLVRRQQLARMLYSNALTPQQGVQAGRVYVGPSWTQGLAQMFSAYAGGKINDDVSRARSDLSQKRGAALADALSNVPQPTTVESELSPGQVGPGLPEQQAPNYAPWLARLAQIDPQSVAIGTSLMNNQERYADRKENRAFMKEQRDETRASREAMAQQAIDARKEMASESRAAAAERQQALFAQQQSMARLAASLRQPQQPQAPIAIIGPDGNPVLVPPSQSYGKQPYSAKAGAPPAPEYSPPEGFRAIRLQKPLQSAQAEKVTEAMQGSLQAAQIAERQQELYDTISKKYGSGLLAKGMAGIASLAGVDPLIDEYKSNQLKMVQAGLAIQKGVQTEGDAVRELGSGVQIGMTAQAHRKVTERAVRQARQAINMNEAMLNGYALVPNSVGGDHSPATSTGNLSPAEQAELDALRKRFGK